MVAEDILPSLDIKDDFTSSSLESLLSRLHINERHVINVIPNYLHVILCTNKLILLEMFFSFSSFNFVAFLFVNASQHFRFVADLFQEIKWIKV